MNIFDLVLLWINENAALAVFGGTFLFGDEMVYFFAFLSGYGAISFWIVVLFSIIGNGGCDIFWFFVAKSRFSDKAKKLFVIRRKTDPEKLSERDFSKKRMFMTLCLSKFFYGTRLLAIFYVAGKEKKFWKIILYNALAVIVWVLVVANIMWYVGKWTAVSFDTMNQAHKILSLAVLFVLVFYVFSRLIVPRITERLRNKKN